ncbi:MAG: carboxypeptidase regulatory-like domain-containing protein [Candidatus Sulfotelmatobacter sp.]
MSSRFTKYWLVAALALTGLFALQAFGQNSVTGAINGTVTDASSAVVPNAAITLINTETGVSSSTTTNASGSYNFPLLTPGVYKIAVKQQGFRTTEETAPVAVGQSTTINIKLEVGQTAEVVEVSGAAPLIQTEDANISTSFSAKQVDLIPNGGNDLTAIAQTAPGVQMNTSSGGGYGNFTAFGLPATSNLFTVNGNDENDPYLNLNNSGATNLLLGKNEVQETSVVSNGYTGQYGRMAGAQVDYATKSGTNAWHGNALYYFNSGGMNANDWFLNQSQTPLPQENNNQWAASIGGPIKKDKLFFFFDTEGLRYVLGTSQLTVVPTPAFASAVVANLPANSSIITGGAPSLNNSGAFYTQLFNAYDTAPGLGRAVPVDDNFDTTLNLGCGDLNVGGNFLQGLGQFGGLPTTFNGAYGVNNGGGGVPCSEQFHSNAGQLSHEYIIAGKVDWNATNNDKLNFRVRTDRGLQATYTDPVSPVFNDVSGQPQDEGQMNWTHTFGPRVLNSFIASGLYYSAFFKSPNQAAATSLFPYAMLDFDTNEWSNLGGINYNFPQGRNVTQAQFVDDLSITRGAHEIKVGVNYKRLDITDGIFGVRSVTPLTEVGSTSDLVSGYIDVFAQRFPTKLEQPIAMYSVGFYAQDQWRVNKDLKLTLTLRADRNSDAVCQDNCFSTLSAPFDQIAHDINTPYNQLIKANQKTAFPEIQKIVMQPRFGFAWSPMGRTSTVLRGGVGLFSDLYPGTIVDSFARNSPSLNSFVLDALPYSPGEGAASAESTIVGTNSAFNANFAAGGNAQTFLATAPLGAARPTYNSIENEVKNPTYLEWNFELQQSLGNKSSFSLNYVGNHGYDEFVNGAFFNTYFTGNTTTATFEGLPTTRPDDHFGVVTELKNAGESNYDGLTASFTRRFTAGFTGSFNYTWSHAADDVSNGGVEPYSLNDSFLNQIDPTSLRRLNYGNADYDVRHNISANYVWELPFKASGMMNKVVSGWVFSGTVFWRSGYPYTVTDGGVASNDIAGMHNGTSLTVMPDFLGGATPSCDYPGRGTPTQCLVNTQFTGLGAETNFGNIPRNSFRGPHYFNTDFSILKNIPLTEKVNFGIGANAYNVLNHPNFANPVHDISAGNFGQIDSTVEPPTSPYGAFVGSAVSGRLLQVQARITF